MTATEIMKRLKVDLDAKCTWQPHLDSKKHGTLFVLIGRVEHILTLELDLPDLEDDVLYENIVEALTR